MIMLRKFVILLWRESLILKRQWRLVGKADDISFVLNSLSTVRASSVFIAWAKRRIE